MPKFITDTGPMEIRELPLVIEIREKDKTTYFSITNEKEFYDNYLQTDGIRPISGPFPDVEHIKELAQKYGTEMSAEEFEKGDVFPAVDRRVAGKGYTEYRFRAPD